MSIAPTRANLAFADAGSTAAKIGRIAGVTAIAIIVFASLYFAVLYLGSQ